MNKASVASLRRPAICRVIILNQEDAIVLRLYWIADSPETDEVIIHFKVKSTRLPIHPADSEANLKEAENSVIFHASYRFEKDSDVGKLLNSGVPFTLELMKDGEVVSNTVAHDEVEIVQ